MDELDDRHELGQIIFSTDGTSLFFEAIWLDDGSIKRLQRVEDFDMINGMRYPTSFLSSLEEPVKEITKEYINWDLKRPPLIPSFNSAYTLRCEQEGD